MCHSHFLQRFVWRFICLSGLLGPWALSHAGADVIYTYTGNNFTVIANPTPPAGSSNTSMSVSGWFLLPTALSGNLVNQQIVPSSFRFFDGRNALSHNSNLSAETFMVSTNSAGELTDWSITLQTVLNNPLIRIIESFNGGFGLFFDQGSIGGAGLNADSGRVNNNPGTWTIANIPEPNTIWCLGAGILCLAVRFDRRGNAFTLAAGQSSLHNQDKV